MSQGRRQFFSLHELLMMAALAALGGVCSSALSNVRAAVHAIVPSPIGMQPLAGIHVLWFVLATGLIRKPGAATVTGMLTGAVEFLSGNPHGTFVILYSGLGGVGVDAAWLLMCGHHRAITYMLAGGMGAASNVVVLKLIGSLPSHQAVNAGLALLGGIAFISGSLLAGLLGWWLLGALRLAGAVGARSDAPAIITRRSRARAGVALAGAALALAGTLAYLGAASADPDEGKPVQTARDPVTRPR